MTLRTAMLLPILALCLSQCSFGQDKGNMHKYSNDLIHESSPYLLQHAHNPVNWHAWSKSSLDEAAKLNKPLIISVGYSSCHWCHVMEHESFEDEEVAAYMNEHFYCIKVDREERPDVDQIYMTAANIITGRGGWPLNCFALPDGRPFHAGTYYPKKDWLNLLQNVVRQYESNLAKLETYAQKLTDGIRMQETAISDKKESALDPQIHLSMVSKWQSSWDMELGGRKGAPKFPMPSNLEYLLQHAFYFDSKDAERFVNTSLDAMAFGGIYDQIGGGFARYATDPYWKIPHFEKMLYDNGQLIKVYAMAYGRTQNPTYKRVVEESLQWLSREMKDESGLYYSALDADSEGEEGKFYIWTKPELEQSLGEDFALAQKIYQLDERGLWENDHYILMQDGSLAHIAVKHDLDLVELQSGVERIKQKLLNTRKHRIRPGLDDKCLSSWNGLLLSGMAKAYQVLPSQELFNACRELADALIAQRQKDGRLWHSYKGGRQSIDGLLEDYAFVGLGLLDFYSISSETRYYKQSLELAEKAHDLFYDSAKGIYYMHLENELIVRTTEVYDNVIPSSNAAMNELVYKLGLLEGKPAFLQASKSLIAKVQNNMVSYPAGHSFWGLNHLAQTQDYYEIAIIGKNAAQLAKELQKRSLFNCFIVFSEKESGLPIFENRYKKGKTLIYLCQKGICELPIETLDSLPAQFNSP